MTITHLNRKQEFDILKGLLIVCVVMGHTDTGIPFIDVFWFHMPAFFMITGFLTRSWLSPIDIFHAIKIKDKFILSRLAKYLIPYFTYCFVFYLIFHTEPALKNIVRVFYAGSNNVTIYSFPYWYINALFIGILAMGVCTTWEKKYQYGVIVIIWIFLHTGVIHLLPVPLPWGIDNALGAVVYLYIGYIANMYIHEIKSLKRLKLLFLFVPALFIFVNFDYSINYQINMKSMIYNYLFLDLVVPISFTYLLYNVSCILKHIPVFNAILICLGNASMTIYFTHAAILWIMRDTYSDFIRISTGLIVGIILHRLFSYIRILQILFLGKFSAFKINI